MPTKTKTTARKRTVSKKKPEVKEDLFPYSIPQDPEKKSLTSYPIEELVKWRDSAKQRVVAQERKLDAQRKVISKEVGNFKKLHTKYISDYNWINKLERTMKRKIKVN